MGLNCFNKNFQTFRKENFLTNLNLGNMLCQSPVLIRLLRAGYFVNY